MHGRAPGGALAASHEVDYLDRVAGLEPDGVVLCAWDDGLVDFDGHPVAAHFEPLEQRGQAGVARDRVLFTVELDCEARWSVGHRKSRFPGFRKRLRRSRDRPAD